MGKDNYIPCFECGEPASHKHHPIPKSLGGTKVIDLCLECHSIVHERDFIKHDNLRKLGIERAKKEGKYKGRQKGTKLSNESLIKKHKDIVFLLQNSDFKDTHISKRLSKGLSTVKRMKKIIDLVEDEFIIETINSIEDSDKEKLLDKTLIKETTKPKYYLLNKSKPFKIHNLNYGELNKTIFDDTNEKIKVGDVCRWVYQDMGNNNFQMKLINWKRRNRYLILKDF